METQKSTTVKHINAKVFGVDPKDAIRTKGPIFMARIYGVLQGVKTFEDRRSGDIKTVLIGEFMAQSGDGKLVDSDKMFCFRALEEKLSSAFKSGEEKAIEFAYDISSLPDDKAATGYIYTAKSVIPTQTSDRLAAMAKEIGNVALPVTAPANGATQPAQVTNAKGKK